MGAIGTVKIEVLESVDGTNFVENGTDITTGKGAGGHILAYTPTQGVRKAKFKITEEGVAGVTFDLEAGIL